MSGPGRSDLDPAEWSVTIEEIGRAPADAAVRVLGRHDLDEALAICDRTPITNVFVAARIRDHGLSPTSLGARVWAHGYGEQAALCYAGANLIPVCAGPEALRAFVGAALRRGRECSSIVGPSAAVERLWDGLAGVWGPARAIRTAQPLLATSVPPAVDPDPEVRVVTPEDLPAFLPASVAMYTEEVGVSPLAHDGDTLYRARVRSVVTRGRALARFDRGAVVFKAEIGAVTPQACQIQGVWVPSHLRGRGLGTAGIAAVVAYALDHVAPVVTLYVNDFNVAARRSYERIGMRQVEVLRSVLF